MAIFPFGLDGVATDYATTLEFEAGRDMARVTPINIAGKIFLT
jgi:hypothetical protein